MDTIQARTFLHVVATGNFLSAARNLHVSQSTVSARIQALERLLGAKLFHRSKQGAELTPAGKRFLRHAQALTRTVEIARQDVGLPEGYSAGLTLCGRIALWDGFLSRWAAWMREVAPTISLRLEIGFESDIMQGLIHNTIDIGVMYTPEARPGLVVERLFDEILVLVSADPDSPWPDPGYVHVDWGPEFFHQFSVQYPDHPPPAFYANIGWLGIRILLQRGGSGYFPLRVVSKALEQGKLHRIQGAPSFRLPAYVVYPATHPEAFLEQALEGMRSLGHEERRRKT